MSLCCECCVLSGRGLCDGLITRPEEPYRLWCVMCDLETSWMRSPWPNGGCCAKRKREKYISVVGQARQDFLTENGGTTVLLHVLMIYQSTRRNSKEHLDLRYWSYEYFGLQTLLAKFKKKLLGQCCLITTISTYRVSKNHFTAHEPHLPPTNEQLPCVWKYVWTYVS
jgi:hypothetical protein